MTDQERTRGSGGEFQATVTDEEILATFRAADTPVLTAQLIADELPISRQAVHERLQTLYKQQKVDRLKVGGRAVVWWGSENI